MNHSFYIDYKDFIKLLKKCKCKTISIIVNIILTSDNPYPLEAHFLEEHKK